jgi:hypothetical protein
VPKDIPYRADVPFRSVYAGPAISSALLRESIDAAGGFTVRRRDGRFRAHGVCVATRPHIELSFARADWDDVVVDAWLASFSDARRWRASHFGGWIDPDTGAVVLDVVRVIPCRLKRLAVVVGRLTKQEFAFDLSTQRLMVLS